MLRAHQIYSQLGYFWCVCCQPSRLIIEMKCFGGVCGELYHGERWPVVVSPNRPDSFNTQHANAPASLAFDDPEHVLLLNENVAHIIIRQRCIWYLAHISATDYSPRSHIHVFVSVLNPLYRNMYTEVSATEERHSGEAV